MRHLLVLLVLVFAAPLQAQQEEPPAEPAPQPEAKEPLLAHVERIGDGPVTMVLIPALWSDWTTFEDFMVRNAHRYTMYAVTFRGYAGSDPPPEPLDPSEYVSQAWRSLAMKGIRKLIDDEGLEDVVLVGHYSGGQLAIRLAIEHPTYVSKVVSIDGALASPMSAPGGRPTRDERTYKVKRMAGERVPQPIWEKSLRITARKMVVHPGRAEVLGDMMALVPMDVGKRYFLEWHAEDLHDRIDGLRVPLLAVVPIPPELDDAQADRLHDDWLGDLGHIDMATVQFIDEARQFVMYDQPEAFDEAVATFVLGEDATPDGDDEPDEDDPAEPDDPPSEDGR